MGQLDGQRAGYDAIVVGARVAGAATAIGLAGRGRKVLLLDAATFPSDTLSTHLLWSDGLARLDRLGVLDAIVATDAPPIGRVRLAFGPHSNAAPIPTHPGYPPLLSVRRLVLDELLLRRARQTPGITVREGLLVESLLVADGEVKGIRGTRRGGEPFAARGRITIGADGRRSMVARAAGAAEYDVVPPLLATYYRYYCGVAPLDVPTLEGYRDAEGGFCYLFPCDAGLWTLAISFPQAEFARVRRDHAAALAEQIARKSGLAERLAGAEAVGPWRGAGDLVNFFRVPHGPGWALVGDAGYHRDPITGRGIADALHGAELLADALDRAWRGDAAMDAALNDYQAARDAAVRPLYDFTVDRPPAGLVAADWFASLGRALSDPAYLSAYIGFMATVTPPGEFYSAEAMHSERVAGG